MKKKFEKFYEEHPKGYTGIQKALAFLFGVYYAQYLHTRKSEGYKDDPVPAVASTIVVGAAIGFIGTLLRIPATKETQEEENEME